MEATLCLKSPRSNFLPSPPNCFHRCHSSLRRRDHLLTYRRTMGFSHGSLRSTTRAQTHPSPSSARTPEASKAYGRSLASVVGAAAFAGALACAGGCIGPSWSKTRPALAAPWFNIPIQSSADRGPQDARRDSARGEQHKKAREVIAGISARRHLPGFKMIPNYEKLKEYIEDHLRLSDEAWDTLVKKWKELQAGQDQVEIGLLLVDIYITKGNAAAAQEINEGIKKEASQSDQRPQIRSVVISMISKDGEKKKNWEKFAQEIQEIASSRVSSMEEPKETP